MTVKEENVWLWACQAWRLSGNDSGGSQLGLSQWGGSRLSKAAPLFGAALFEAPSFVAAREMLSIANTICDQTNLSDISLNL